MCQYPFFYIVKKLFFKESPVPLSQWFFSSIFEELSQIQLRKNSILSLAVFSFLPLCYTQLQQHKLLLKEFKLSSVSLLNKIIKGHIDVIKTVTLLYKNGSLPKNIFLVFDMHLKPPIIHNIFEANSSFHAKQRTTEKV